MRAGNQPWAQGSTRVQGAASDSEQMVENQQKYPRGVLETRRYNLCNRRKGRNGFTVKTIKRKGETERKKGGKPRSQEKKLHGASQRGQWKPEQSLRGTTGAEYFSRFLAWNYELWVLTIGTSIGCRDLEAGSLAGKLGVPGGC